MKPPLLIQGMHGMGDCLHQRAVVRQAIENYDVWLETSWPSIYYDLDVQLKRRPVSLRTQSKNANREIAKFTGKDVPRGAEIVRVSYSGADVLRTDSKTVLEAMCRNTFTNYATADFRLPVPDDWHQQAVQVMGRLPQKAETKPWLVYRPLVARTEWRGSAARNANEAAYTHLLALLREHFFVISVADLHPGKEWIVGPQLKADMTFHNGELHFEALAALFNQADLVFTSSGFAAVLAPAVGTPVVNIVGGYELPSAHDSGSKFAPMLTIGPRVPCKCWTSACNQLCIKDTDMTDAVRRLGDFISRIYGFNIFPRVGDPNDMFETDFRPVSVGRSVQSGRGVMFNQMKRGLKA